MADFIKVVDGLYQINGYANVFVLDDGEHGVTVIDTGMPHSVNAIVDTVKAIGRTVGDIKQILVTHADIDHIGSLAPLVTASNAKIIAGNKSKHYIESRLAPPHGPVFFATDYVDVDEGFVV
jgi:glyoxylase-like metal-dependent hydrolase (beta-lactamase superfamily II)